MRLSAALLLLLSPALLAAAPARDCRPLETGPANVPEQQPAFPGQTRACAAERTAVDVKVLTAGLEHPWAVEPLPDGDLLVTERAGRLRVVTRDGKIGEPVQGLPEIHAGDQAGLLDVALSPDFARDRTIFWSYSEPRDDGNGTAVARGVLSEDRSRVDNVKVIFRAQPGYANNMHYGSRLLFDDDGLLYVTLGERSDLETRGQAQALDSHYGKLIRIHPDGSIPDDNPFTNKRNAKPEIWTLGHRNAQAAAFDANGELWVIEHGARGGDELNRIEKGKNYGWPLVAYGEEYSGEPLQDAATTKPGTEQPVYYWDPVIAPSGAVFYEGDAFADWNGDLLIGALAQRELVRLELADGRVVAEEHLLGNRNQRVRDVQLGDDGALYIVTDEDKGELWRVTPRTP